MAVIVNGHYDRVNRLTVLTSLANLHARLLAGDAERRRVSTLMRCIRRPHSRLTYPAGLIALLRPPSAHDPIADRALFARLLILAPSPLSLSL